MSAPVPSRAGDLNFEPSRPTRDPLTITIKVVVNGYECELTFVGTIDQLDAITKRLAILGAEPASRPAPAKGPQKPAQRVQPAYDGDGSPICPTHKRALQQGKWGLFCSSKDRETGEYCKLKFAE